MSTTSAEPPDQQQQSLLLWTRKAFHLGLAVQLAPQAYYTQSIRTTVLANLQVLALQLARLQLQLQQPQHLSYPATLWAAQTAMWQMTLHPSASSSNNSTNNNDNSNAKQQQRLAMLPRLAESFASKCVHEYSSPCSNYNDSDNTTDATDHNSLLVSESFLLYMKTLDLQKKWTEKLAILEERLQSPQQTSSQPSRQTLLELKLETLQQQCCGSNHHGDLVVNQSNGNMRATIEELLRLFPDDWDYWQHLLRCCIAEGDGDVEYGCSLTEVVIEKTLQEQQQQHQQHQQRRSYPLRGPHLMRVEIAARKFRHQSSKSSTDVENLLLQRVQEYGDAFAPRASCAFSDLQPYLRLVLLQQKEDPTTTSGSDATAVQTLLGWSRQLRSRVPSSNDSKIRHQELRTYLFAVKVNYTVCHDADSPWRQEELPCWEELVTVWKDFQSFEVAKNT